MFACDCCAREVVPRKLPGLGYWCDPCLEEQTWREYPWGLDSSGRTQYREARRRHEAVCEVARTIPALWHDGRS